MDWVQTKFKLIISGIKLVSDFRPIDTVHSRYVRNVNCSVGERDNTVVVTGTICSEDQNKNFLIAEDLTVFFLRLFSLFGVNCRVEHFELDKGGDVLWGYPPVPTIDGKMMNDQIGKVKSLFFEPQSSAEFQAIQASTRVDVPHHFRTLAALFFEELCPRWDDHVLEKYVEALLERYENQHEKRLLELIQVLCDADLTDFRTQLNQSSRLQSAMQNVSGPRLIDDNVAHGILACIEVIYLQMRQGNYDGLNRKLISSAHELLLPLVQKLLRSRTLDNP
ncbi:hypothetical protein L1765_08050 [Microaerobacter geothermalis]|uniref:hypothetical protein n=1 Tax=Microaerobacter geothermalis TaxID=674972 RepID=UPI001F3CFA9D|nr:hypothetical protein [Microaerobacter geothermalis]MCF6093922.1 hypothetical protein [Microaerobacter geothermalis]